MFSRYVVSQVKHNSYFLVGLAIGLWLALAAVPLEEEVVACETEATVAAADEFEPQREERPLGPAGQPGRSVQRPRYYSTELGMRSGLLAGVLSSEQALAGRAAALNRTAARLQPALRFFITASALQAAPGRANVVGFTDTREMLKPFHALKYLADNYLEEYDFFFLVSDTSFVNSRRLLELVSKLSVSQDIYMGTVAEDDTHYCTLEGGILLSNSVLRAVHGELDWCVRNSYSPHHHENLGRCVLHAAHAPCAPAAQALTYRALRVPARPGAGGVAGALVDALADAVVAYPVLQPEHFYQLHAFVSRVYLQRAQAAIASERAVAALSARRHPRGYRNATWPPALRDDAGLAPALPPTRFDHLRWTRFNLTHAFMPDDHRALAPLSAAYKQAVDLVVGEVGAWAARRWGAAGGAVALEEGAWCWDPPRALRYRLLLRVPRAEVRAASLSLSPQLVVGGWARGRRRRAGGGRVVLGPAARAALPPAAARAARRGTSGLPLPLPAARGGGLGARAAPSRWRRARGAGTRRARCATACCCACRAPRYERPPSPSPRSSWWGAGRAGGAVALEEGAWCWDPPRALRYRLLLRVPRAEVRAASLSLSPQLVVGGWARGRRRRAGGGRVVLGPAARAALPPAAARAARRGTSGLPLPLPAARGGGLGARAAPSRWRRARGAGTRRARCATACCCACRAPRYERPPSPSPRSSWWGAGRAGGAVALEEGAWCWDPPRALRYRLLLRVPRAEVRAASLSLSPQLVVGGWARGRRRRAGGGRVVLGPAARAALPPAAARAARRGTSGLPLPLPAARGGGLGARAAPSRWRRARGAGTRRARCATACCCACRAPRYERPPSPSPSPRSSWWGAGRAGGAVALEEGAWCWDPPRALRYRLLLRVPRAEVRAASLSLSLSPQLVVGGWARGRRRRAGGGRVVLGPAARAALPPAAARAARRGTSGLPLPLPLPAARGGGLGARAAPSRWRRARGAGTRRARCATACCCACRAPRYERPPSPSPRSSWWGAGRAGGAVALEEGAWCWDPPRALRYRLLLRVPRAEVRAASLSLSLSPQLVVGGWARGRRRRAGGGRVVLGPAARAALPPAAARAARRGTSGLPLPLPAARGGGLGARAAPSRWRRARGAGTRRARCATACCCACRAPRYERPPSPSPRSSWWGAGRAGGAVALEEGAWCWDPPRALRYRLLLRVPRAESSNISSQYSLEYNVNSVCVYYIRPWAARAQGPGALLQVEAARALGGARLAPARYVTESARVLLLLPLPAPLAAALPAFLQRYEAACLQRDANTALYVVVVPTSESATAEAEAALAAAREALLALAERHSGATLEALQAAPGAPAGGAPPAGASESELQRYAARAALPTLLPHVSRDALLLLALPHMEFTEDFLNRVRMNTIPGEQWFLPLPFARFAQYDHPRFADSPAAPAAPAPAAPADRPGRPARPALHTGRFAAARVLSVTRRDYELAAALWAQRGGAPDADAADVLSAAPLRALRAPEPALLLAPRGPPCGPPPAGASSAPSPGGPDGACLRRERERGFADLQLGARQELAKLLLQTQAELA
ncbi:unnamed protein product [Euphydryas editha]|uniref:Hexosyltransferase n=1 Tax=Euphydryas editha TaxID=104508 RepID=A0AAU9UG26_EUPED|nr:unnamed protein product [Euphydryas editha]